MYRRFKLFLGSLFVALALFGCGGGGGGSSGASEVPGYTVSTGSVSFSATQGNARPASQTVQVEVTAGTVFVDTTQSGNGFTHTFNIIGETTGQITITPDVPNTAGTFTGSIQVFGCADQFCRTAVAGSPKIINVTYNVQPAVTPIFSVSPASIAFTSNTGALPADPSRPVYLTLSSGSDSWLASVNYTAGTSGWLSLPGTGTVNTTPSCCVALSVSGTPPSSAEVRTVTVTFTTNGGLTRSVNVSWTISASAVEFVAPYVATAGVGGNVIIRGHGFSSLNPATTTVQFGSGPASLATVINDTEIHATYPALAAGTYAPVVTDGGVLMLDRATAQLVVVAAPSFAATTIARGTTVPAVPGGVGDLIYDAERKALLLSDVGNNRVYRYAFVSGTTWTEAATAPVGASANMRIALSPDGTKLLQTGTPSMVELDPVSLTPTASVSAASFLGGGGSLNMIAFGNDGGAIGNVFNALNGITLFRYDFLTQQFAELSETSDMTNRTIAAAANGDMLLLPTYEPLAPGFYKPIARYDSTSGAGLSTVGATTGGTEAVSVSRDASKSILAVSPLSADQEIRVYDASMALLGKLPASIAGFVITPDANFAYAYFSDTNRVRKFDLNAPSGGGFTEIGSGQTIASPGSFFSKMAITPDGGTLFIAGTTNLIVLPAF